jgi:hypothetical protein
MELSVESGAECRIEKGFVDCVIGLALDVSYVERLMRASGTKSHDIDGYGAGMLCIAVPSGTDTAMFILH